MKSNTPASIALLIFCALFWGCTSIVKVPPYPDATAWDKDVQPLGTVTADSGKWPLSLHTTPSDYTIQAALRAKAAKDFGVPESEIVLSEASVQIGAELDGTIRDWKATASAGRKKAGISQSKATSEKLLELKKLFDAGAITSSEYEAKKRELLEKL
jgi:hypothetical protein